jgi:hypothetical protein
MSFMTNKLDVYVTMENDRVISNTTLPLLFT